MTARTRPSGRVRPPARTAAVLISCLVIGTAACGGTDEPPPSTDPSTTASRGTTAGSTPGSSPGTTTGTTVVDEEAAVLETVERYWDTWLAANNPPNPDHPDLAKYATGDTLARSRQTIAKNAAEGIIYEAPPDSQYSHRLTVEQVSGKQATVIDCAADDYRQVRMADGQVVNDEVGTQLLRITVIREDGSWKVSLTEREGSWPGISDCS